MTRKELIKTLGELKVEAYCNRNMDESAGIHFAIGYMMAAFTESLDDYEKLSKEVYGEARNIARGRREESEAE